LTVTLEFATAWIWAIGASERQAQVIMLAWVEGRPDAEIAAQLGIAVGTVGYHRSEIKRKTREHNWLSELRQDAEACWEALCGPQRPDPATPIFREDKREPAFPHPPPVDRRDFVSHFVENARTRKVDGKPKNVRK